MSEFSGDTPSDSAATGNVDARLRSSLGARGTTPELSPDLITNAPSREAPHLVNRQRRIQAAGGATLAIAAVTVGALVVSLPSQRAPLFLAASSSGSAEVGSAASSSLNMGADAAASDLRIAQWIDYRYEAGAALSGEAGTGSVYQLKRVGTVESRLRDVAGALGVTGEPTKATYFDPAYPTWMVGTEDGTAASVTITWAGTGDWWFNDPTASPQVVCTAVPFEDVAGDIAIEEGAGDIAIGEPTACEVPPAPAEQSLAPSEAEARAEARALFGKTGLDVSADEIRVTADAWQTVATASLTVDGTQTALESTVAWSATGQIAWASGHSVEVVDRGRFGTISEAAAVERISDYRWFGAAGPEFQGGMQFFATDLLRSEDATGAPVSPDTPVTSVAPGGPDAPVSSPAEPPTAGEVPGAQGVDPGGEPIIEPNPGTSTEPATPPSAEPVPAPSAEPVPAPTLVPLPTDEPPALPTAEPLPEPTTLPQPLPETPEVVVVKVDKATSTLLMMWDAEGNAWLVPGLAMQHPDGWWNTIVSLDDGVIELPAPMEIEPVDGGIGEGTDEGVVRQ